MKDIAWKKHLIVNKSQEDENVGFFLQHAVQQEYRQYHHQSQKQSLDCYWLS
jgi:hypothetical protein